MYSLGYQLSAPVFNELYLEVACLSESPHLCHNSIHLVLVGLDLTLYQLTREKQSMYSNWMCRAIVT